MLVPGWSYTMTDAQTDSSLRDYGLAVPHGPNMDGRHVASANARDQIHDMNQNEKDIFYDRSIEASRKLPSQDCVYVLY